ncbi:hypothetical protein Pelo_18143 [Pelomyxa schiedti]|nr:hypothetical protein Pelo_18143 [Pelomyxa schiedti]
MSVAHVPARRTTMQLHLWGVILGWIVLHEKRCEEKHEVVAGILKSNIIGNTENLNCSPIRASFSQSHFAMLIQNQRHHAQTQEEEDFIPLTASSRNTTDDFIALGPIAAATIPLVISYGTSSAGAATPMGSSAPQTGHEDNLAHLYECEQWPAGKFWQSAQW